jgi:hypothetical protein
MATQDKTISVTEYLPTIKGLFENTAYNTSVFHTKRLCISLHKLVL